MGIARNIARLIPNGSGLLPNANIEAVAASKLTGSVALATQVSGTLPDANAPSGSVIQMVQKQVTTQYSTSNSDSWQSAGDFDFSITPSSSSSVIVGIYNIFGYCDHVNGGVSNLALRIQRGGSTVKEATALLRLVNTGSRVDLAVATSLIFYDAPNSTSSTSYVFNYRSNIGNVDYGLNRTYHYTSHTFASHLILLEIKP